MDQRDNSFLELVDTVFIETDQRVERTLHQKNPEYQSMLAEKSRMELEMPCLTALLEGEEEIHLSKDELLQFQRYYSLILRMDEFLRKQLYCQGHIDCMSYIKRMGLIGRS